MYVQSIMAPSAYISFVTVLFHLLLTWLTVYKLGWGLFGVAIILSLSWWIIVIVQYMYIITSPRCKHTWMWFAIIPQAFCSLCCYAVYVNFGVGIHGSCCCQIYAFLVAGCRLLVFGCKFSFAYFIQASHTLTKRIMTVSFSIHML